MINAISSTALRTVIGTVGTILCAGICLAGAAAPAAAAEAVRVQNVVVADLDLSSAQGHALAEKRLQAAARSVCSVEGNDLKALAGQGSCRSAAIADAHVQLAALAARSGRIASN